MGPLEDAYWRAEGRSSFDAVVCACAFAALVVIGLRPFGLDDPGSVLGTALVVAVVLGLAAVAFAKGRIVLGVIGLFIPLVELARSQWRFAPTRPLARSYRRIGDLVAGPLLRNPPEPRAQP